MKKLLLLFAALLTLTLADAQRISEQQAFQKAQKFLQDKHVIGEDNARKMNRAPQQPADQAYYIFNVEQQGGFVIVAGDERMPEVLGYSSSGSIDMDNAPCGLKWLLGCYEQMAKNVESGDGHPAKSRAISAKAPVAPFVSTTWGQSTPYNAMCPKVNGAKALTGCVATAMAQIMNYYCWPNEVTEPIPAYTTTTHNVSMPELEPTTFTWGHLNKNQLSKLMLYCGQAVQMDYDYDLSGAYPVMAAESMKDLFGYDETISYIEHDNYSDEEWDNLLYNELVAQRPILYGGDDGTAGHAFIVCGFANDLFYINWGWNGYADGYYVLDGISQSLGGYNYNQRAIVGIIPKGMPIPVTYYPRKVVMENRAWSYDGQYITGLETVNRLTKEYPDNFIGIQMHVSDPMMGAENYEAIKEKTSCDPHCLINRTACEFSPVYPEIKSLVEAQKDAAVAMVNASAVYAKPDKSAIKVVAESTFGFDGTDEDFRLAFVLLEDNVGPYKLWNDFYSNPDAPDDPDDWLNDWRHKDAHLEMMFDDVARGIYGSPWGIEGSVPAQVQSGKTYHYEYSFNVPTPIQQYNDEEIHPYNTENFRVVALLIDKTTGEIMNACQTKIDYDASVESQTFEFRNKGKRLNADEVQSWKSKGIEEEYLVLGTNLKQDGLTLATFDGKQATGTATLEILTNTLDNAALTWGMSGEDMTITGNSQTISFTTKTNGQAEVQLKANDISQFGELEAKLTATVNGFSRSVIIKLIHQQSEIQIGDDIELEDEQGWWLNGSVESSSENADGLMFGTGKQERYYLATYIPANLFGDKVPTIDGIGFYGSTVGMGDVKVWISSHLLAKGEEPDIATYSFTDEPPAVNRFNEIVFNQHYQIPESGVYVGYSFDIVDMSAHRSGSPIIYSEKTREGALWWMTEGEPEWKDHDGYVEGNLAIKILFGGNVVKKNAASITKVQPVFEMVNTEPEFVFEISNDGSEPITSFTVEIDGEPHYIGLGWSMNPYSKQAFTTRINTGSVAEYQQKTVTITEVNEKPNETIENDMTGDWFISRQKSPTVAVMEEFTATWCGWSFAANKALDIYQEQFGDRLIEICAHGSSIWQNDPMEIPEYSEIRALGQGNYPSCLINRTRGDKWIYDCDDWMAPFYNGYGEGTFNLDVNINNVLNRIMPGQVEIVAAWGDDSQDAIKIQTRTTFELNASELPFQIGYVLLEDSLCGEGDEWAQYNSIITDDHNFDDIAALPEMNYGYKYNKVPVAAWDAYKGIEGSLVGPFNAGMPVYSSFDASIENNTLIQNKENLTLVALLVNKETGKIINAAKCQIQPYGTDISVVEVKANNYTRKYGEANPVFEYTTSGGELIGTPVITCEATETSPVGEYPIIITQGTVSNYNVTYIAGTLTIEAAPLTISAGEYTKRQYEPMPEFSFSYSGFKNNETAAVLTTQPVVTCNATEDSAPGVYPVTVSGAEAQNYDISYIDGTLTVTEPASYTLTYFVDGEVYKTFTLKQNEIITPEPEPEKEGYTFSGWSEIPTTMPAHDVTVTGSFSINSYKLTYLVDGEEYKVYELEYGVTITPEAEPTREGYTFSGWSEIPATMPVHDVTVTGSFSINSYKLVYLVDGEEYKTYELEYGAAITPEAAPTKEGYTFSGWTEIPETMPAHDVTVTGTFSINKYKLTYLVDGEEYKAYELEYGVTITPEAEPTKEGYTFSGWSEIPETMPAHDVTVTGTFTINTYKLTYIIDDKVYKEVMYEYSATITPEPQPEGDYARFEWIGVPETMPANDVVVYASYETGIIDLLTLQGVKAIYAPNGKKLDKPQKGLNIVIMNDGRVRRVVVK